MPRIAVIIPAKNEEANIRKVMRDIRAHIPEAAIVIVDDRSEDGTAETAIDEGGAFVLRSPITLGIGGAVQLGVRFALSQGCDLFLRMDGDGQHSARSARALLDRWTPATLVQGARPHARFLASSSWIRKFGSLYFHLLFRACAFRNVPDPTSGLMCFGKDIAIKFSRFYPTDFPEVESLVLLIRSGHRVVSAPVEMHPRLAGTSSIRLAHAAVYMLSVSIAFFSSFIRKNPYAASWPPGAAHAAA